MKRIITPILTVFFVLVISGCSDDDKVETTEQVVTTIVDAAINDGNFTTLVTALQATGLDQTLADTTQQFTVFAPTDSAFALLGQDTIEALLQDTAKLSDILTYHVLTQEVLASSAISLAGSTVETVNGQSIGLSLNGDNLLINTATVTTTDIQTDNGVIHVIDAVLMPINTSDSPTLNIVETAVENGSFTTLISALQVTDLDDVLSDETTSFTVFAPTDAAFAMIDQNLLDALIDNPDILSSILLQHVISDSGVDSVTAYTLSGGMAVTASQAEIGIDINADTDMLLFGGANIVIKDIQTTNGIIHVIDMVVVGDVVLPEPVLTVKDVALMNGNFNTLIAALEATGLDLVLDDRTTDFTVFAPTDEAFAKLGQDTIDALLMDSEKLSNILLYHVISGNVVLQDEAVSVAQSTENKVTMANEDMVALSLTGSTLFANQSVVSTPNVLANNGVIHVVDQVILPPSMTDSPTMNIIETASSDSQFSTLVTALQAANLVDTLSNASGNFTVFAPTNNAFDKLEDTELSSLLTDTVALSDVLLQHVVSGAAIGSLDAYAANGSNITMANDKMLSVEIVNFSMYTDGDNAEVVFNDDYNILVGGTASSFPGMSLYVFDNDLGTDGSACNDTCAANWPPVLVSEALNANIPGITTIERDDGNMQAAFNGRPLYFWVGDSAVGDMTGNGVNDVWWAVNQDEVSLQIQGSNITTKDIYTTNGVIHVIDTVITTNQ